MTGLIVCERSELADVVREVVRAELAAYTPQQQPVGIGRSRLTIAEAAKELQCSLRTIHRMLATKQLKASKVGHRVFISRATLDRLIEGSVR